MDCVKRSIFRVRCDESVSVFKWKLVSIHAIAGFETQQTKFCCPIGTDTTTSVATQLATIKTNGY